MRGFSLIIAAAITISQPALSSTSVVDRTNTFKAVALGVGDRFSPNSKAATKVRHPDTWTSGRGRYPGNCQDFAYAVQREALKKGVDVVIWLGVNRDEQRLKMHVVPVFMKNGKPWVFADTRPNGEVVIHPWLEPERFEPMALVRFGDSLSPDYTQTSLPTIGWDTVENRVVLLP